MRLRVAIGVSLAVLTALSGAACRDDGEERVNAQGPAAPATFREKDVPAEVATGPRANRSLGREALLALRIANLFTRQSVVNKTTLVDLPGGQGLRHAAKWLFRHLPSRRFELPADLAAKVDAFYAESNARLAAMCDLPLGELGYPLAEMPAAPHLDEGFEKDAA